MIYHDELRRSSASNVTGFLAARDILGHFVLCRATTRRMGTAYFVRGSFGVICFSLAPDMIRRTS